MSICVKNEEGEDENGDRCGGGDEDEDEDGSCLLLLLLLLLHVRFQALRFA